MEKCGPKHAIDASRDFSEIFIAGSRYWKNMLGNLKLAGIIRLWIHKITKSNTGKLKNNIKTIPLKSENLKS